MEINFKLQRNSDMSYILVAGIVMLIQFFILKYLYPFASFMPDSYNYLQSADKNLDANMWPVGYAKFIRFVGIFAHSDTVLVFFQYFFYGFCALYFFFTILNLNSYDKWVKYIIFFFLFLNPAFLYLSNIISSDVFFIGLSLIWISQLFRLFCQPGRLFLFVHILVLLLAFTVRYHALFYPIISIICILICRLQLRIKFIAIISIVLLVCSFVQYTTAQTAKNLGVHRFSIFSGWQLASNAVFAYAHMSVREPLIVPEKFTTLHQVVTHYVDSARQSPAAYDSLLTAYYLWNYQSPLQLYARMKNIGNNDIPFKSMSAMAPLYHDYGIYLIKKYPTEYIRYYVWPNVKQYILPPLENLSRYNEGMDTIEPIAIKWFLYKTNEVKPRFNNTEIHVFDYYHVIVALIILSFVSGFAGYFLISGNKLTEPKFQYALWITGLYCCCNFIFSILASPVMLRYQLFNMILCFTFSILLIDLFLRADKVPVE
jgi:hypothetical protein